MFDLKAWRNAQGLTQAELAEQFGVRRLTILRYEKAMPAHMSRLVELACSALEKNTAIRK